MGEVFFKAYTEGLVNTCLLIGILEEDLAIGREALNFERLVLACVKLGKLFLIWLLLLCDRNPHNSNFIRRYFRQLGEQLVISRSFKLIGPVLLLYDIERNLNPLPGDLVPFLGLVVL